MNAPVDPLLLNGIACLVGISVCYVLNAVLVACEISLVKLRYRFIEEDPAAVVGETGVAIELIKRSEHVADVIRFILILSSFTAGILIQRMLMNLSILLEFEDQGWFLLLDVIAVFFAITAWYIFAELIPRGRALGDPQRTLQRVGPITRLVVLLLGPWLRLANRIARRVGGNRVELGEDFDLLDVEVQLRALSLENPSFGPLIRKIVTNGLKMNELVVSDIMLPRNQVQILDLSDSLQENIAMAKTAGHTRYPLCEGDLDKCIGVIHIKDIFRFKGPIDRLNLQTVKRKILSLSSEMHLDQALKTLLLKKGHMALVLDEFGGKIGVVTLENIFEQLVGAIDDEFDVSEEDKVSAISLVDYKVDGLTPLHDLEEKLQVDIVNDEVSTFGGLITTELGRFPEKGEKVVLEKVGLSITIDEVDERRIISATVRKLVTEKDPVDET